MQESRRYLIDTHIFLWWNVMPSPYSQAIRSIVYNPQNILLLSVVSIWEMQIKKIAGKLDTEPQSIKIFVEARLDNPQFQILPIAIDHIYTMTSLPQMKHRDPFDRLLVAQASFENIPLLSVDRQMPNYPITVIP